MADYMMNRRDQGPPSPFRERLRFALLFSSFLTALILLFVFWDRDPGGAFLLAVGYFLLDSGVIDLIWLRMGDVERVWLNSRSGSQQVAWARVVGGLVLGVFGVLKLI